MWEAPSSVFDNRKSNQPSGAEEVSRARPLLLDGRIPRNFSRRRELGKVKTVRRYATGNYGYRFAVHRADRNYELRTIGFLLGGLVVCTLGVILILPWWGRLYAGMVGFFLAYHAASKMWSGRSIRDDIERCGYDGRRCPREGYFGAAKVQGELVDAENRFRRLLAEAPWLPDAMSDETIRWTCIYLDETNAVIAVEAFGRFGDVLRNLQFFQKAQGYLWHKAADLYGVDPELCFCRKVHRSKRRGIENDQCVLTFRRMDVAQKNGCDSRRRNA